MKVTSIFSDTPSLIRTSTIAAEQNLPPPDAPPSDVDTPPLIPTSTIAADQNPPLEDNSEERRSFYQLLESIDDKFTMKAMVKYPLERSMEKIMHLVRNHDKLPVGNVKSDALKKWHVSKINGNYVLMTSESRKNQTNLPVTPYEKIYDVVYSVDHKSGFKLGCRGLATLVKQVSGNITEDIVSLYYTEISGTRNGKRLKWKNRKEKKPRTKTVNFMDVFGKMTAASMTADYKKKYNSNAHMVSCDVNSQPGDTAGPVGEAADGCGVTANSGSGTKASSGTISNNINYAGISTGSESTVGAGHKVNLKAEPTSGESGGLAALADVASQSANVRNVSVLAGESTAVIDSGDTTLKSGLGRMTAPVGTSTVTEDNAESPTACGAIGSGGVGVAIPLSAGSESTAGYGHKVNLMVEPTSGESGGLAALADVASQSEKVPVSAGKPTAGMDSSDTTLKSGSGRMTPPAGTTTANTDNADGPTTFGAIGSGRMTPPAGTTTANTDNADGPTTFGAIGSGGVGVAIPSSLAARAAVPSQSANVKTLPQKVLLTIGSSTTEIHNGETNMDDTTTYQRIMSKIRTENNDKNQFFRAKKGLFNDHDTFKACWFNTIVIILLHQLPPEVVKVSQKVHREELGEIHDPTEDFVLTCFDLVRELSIPPGYPNEVLGYPEKLVDTFWNWYRSLGKEPMSKDEFVDLSDLLSSDLWSPLHLFNALDPSNKDFCMSKARMSNQCVDCKTERLSEGTLTPVFAMRLSAEDKAGYSKEHEEYSTRAYNILKKGMEEEDEKELLDSTLEKQKTWSVKIKLQDVVNKAFMGTIEDSVDVRGAGCSTPKRCTSKKSTWCQKVTSLSSIIVIDLELDPTQWFQFKRYKGEKNKLMMMSYNITDKNSTVYIPDSAFGEPVSIKDKKYKLCGFILRGDTANEHNVEEKDRKEYETDAYLDAQTGHYVCFVKTRDRDKRKERWMYFDDDVKRQSPVLSKKDGTRISHLFLRRF